MDEVDLENDMGETAPYRSPFGWEIVSTLETIPGTCGIIWTAPGEGECGNYDYDGTGTKMWWDGAETVKHAGQRVFLDENGNQWLESELVKPGDPLPETYVSPWDDMENIRKLLHEKFAEAKAIIFEDKVAPTHLSEMEANLIEELVAELGILREGAEEIA